MTCIIIEDEIPAQNILKNYLNKLPHLQLLGCFKSATEAFSKLQEISVDILFLDINLPDMSGLDFIKTLAHPPAIVMTTAYPDYALNSFEYETIADYLVKPFSFQRFLKATSKVQKQLKPIATLNQVSETVYLNVDKIFHKIVVNDILYLESNRNYITVFTTTKKLVYLASLKHWIERLPTTRFVQIHKSFVVNISCIEKLSGNTVCINKTSLPIGRSYKAALLNQLNIN